MPADFEPVISVALYPEDIAFKALSHAMRQNHRTYELFEIARLILAKNERLVAELSPLEGDNPPLAEFHVSVPDGIPFESEEAALAHVTGNHLEHFFTVETVETEPPKGNFPIINRCGMTGELLGPPNYHRYQELIREHHASRLAKVPFERFLAKIESQKDEALSAEWGQKMSHIERFTLKPEAADDAGTAESTAEADDIAAAQSDDSAEPTPAVTPRQADGRTAARLLLLSERREAVVRRTNRLKIPGKMIERLPPGPIRKSIESVLEAQRRFPLVTANNLRGRLRRLDFTIYKKGSKGVSYVCAVKRKFRQPGTHFSDSIQKLIEFIEQNPFIAIADLPAKFLGIEPPESVTGQIGSKEKAPVIEAVSTEQAQSIVEAHELKRQARHDDGSGTEDSGPDIAATDVDLAVESQGDAATTPPPVEVKAAESAAPPSAVASGGSNEAFHKLMVELHWLVAEGYVCEFGDGTLFAQPLDPSASHGSQGKRPAKTTKTTEKAGKTTVQSEDAEAGIPPETDNI